MNSNDAAAQMICTLYNRATENLDLPGLSKLTAHLLYHLQHRIPAAVPLPDEVNVEHAFEQAVEILEWIECLDNACK